MKPRTIGGALVALGLVFATGPAWAGGAFSDFIRPDMPNGRWVLATGGSTTNSTNTASGGFQTEYKAAYDQPGQRGLAQGVASASGHRGTSMTGTDYGYSVGMFMFHPDKYGAKGVQSKAGQKSNVAIRINSAFAARTVAGATTFSASASFSGIVPECSAKYKAKGLDEAAINNGNSVKVDFKCKGDIGTVLGLTEDEVTALTTALNSKDGPNDGSILDMRSFGQFFGMSGGIPYDPFEFTP